MGRCPSCGEWNSLVEKPREAVEDAATVAKRRGWLTGLAEEEIKDLTTGPLELTKAGVEEARRYSIKMGELDRVLGGGLVRGSVVLVGGEPGVGKSTLLMQLSDNIAKYGKVIYVSGEESASQIKLRADRLGVASDNILLYTEGNFDSIADHLVSERPVAVIIDSIQTMYTSKVSSAPGSIAQVRQVAEDLLNIAKTLGISAILVGHVTKDGSIAGPRVLEHLVDTVIYFEGDKSAGYRIIRAIKNRFGATDEVGIFEMTSSGLREVPDPSAAMLEGRPKEVSGTAIASVVEGTRPLLIEIQALLSTSSFANPQRITQGIDRVRAGMLIAVAEKNLNLGLGTMDAYINVVGGLASSGNSTDLAVTAAVISAVKNFPIKEDTVIFGEIGLTGEVRPVPSAVKRALEASKSGFKTCILPGACKRQFADVKNPSLPDLIFVDKVRELADVLFAGK